MVSDINPLLRRIRGAGAAVLSAKQPELRIASGMPVGICASPTFTI